MPDSALHYDQLVGGYWKPLLDKGAKAIPIEGTTWAPRFIDGIIAPIAESTKQDILILCVIFFFLDVSKTYFRY